ncbi:MAG: TIGR00366 family protein [Elusimicrobiota bacterium]|jgi:uncharacterized ion transporter superfamily protein YfcC|nr:TIGR00366 family protein [Elusimicrobiota bacterium]
MSRIKINTSMILMALVALTAAATWIIPAGKYETIEKNGRQVFLADSFHYIENSPQNLFDVLQAPMKAFTRSSAAEIMAFLLIIGGAFMIVERTGAITAAIKHLSLFFAKKPKLRHLFIPVSMILFSLGGATFGMCEETLIFIPIFIPLAISLKYDSAVGVAVPFLGAGAGFAGAFMNPFTLGIAQGIAQLPLYSGMGYRIIIWLTTTCAAITFVYLYARRVEKNPKTSITYDFDKEKEAQLKLNKNVHEKFTLSHKLVLSIFGGTFALLIFGVLKYGWYITEIGGLLFGMAVAVSFVSRLKISEITQAFYDGVRSMAEVIFLLALATSVIIIAENGNILGTVLHFMSGAISKFNAVFASWAVVIMQACFDIFIPSGSAKAVLSMPILAPLSDLIGLSRQTMVLAFQLGGGWLNICIPTDPIVISAIAMARIPYQKWLRFVLPLVAVFFAMSFIFLWIAVHINWQ